jgi:hypothetical protein
MIPKELGGKVLEPIHKVCHQKIHATFTNRELLHTYHTFEKLLSHPEIEKFVAWVRKRPPEFYDKNQETNTKRSKRR